MSTRSRRECKNKRVIKIDDSSDESDHDKNANKGAKAKTTTATNGNTKKNDSDLVSKLQEITGLSKTEASQLLEACNNDLDTAVNLHLGTLDAGVPLVTKPTANGVAKKSDTAAIVYDDDLVRAPIPQKSERLIDYDPYSAQRPGKRSRSVFDGFRDLQQEYGESDDGASKSKKRNTLAQLFRPPIDILFSGSFDAAKRLGARANRWILLNVQNAEEFECQCLNRDLWSDDTVKEIIKANFIFVQIYHDVNEGPKLMNYYQVKTFPFVGVIDPRTGEKVAQWNNKLDATHFCELVTNFLSDNELPIEGCEDDPTTETTADCHKIANGNGHAGIDSPNIPNFKYLSFSDRIESTKAAKPVSPKKLNSKQAAEEILKKAANGKKTTLITNNQDSSSSDSDNDESVNNFKNVKITKKEAHQNGHQNGKTAVRQNGNNSAENKVEKSKVAEEASKEVVVPTSLTRSQSIRYETKTKAKDCHLRIMMPNGDRLDFITDGDAAIQLLVDYLKTQGYSKPRYDLIERSFSTTTLLQQPQSRNLFNSNSNETFKQLNLYPRIFLLLQDTS